MVDHANVAVHVLTLGVVVDDHEVLSAERCFGKPGTEPEHLRDVIRIADVEDLRVSGEHEVVGLVLASVRGGLCLGVGDELLG